MKCSRSCGYGYDDAAEPDAAEGEAVSVIQEGRAGPYDYTQIEVNEDLDDPADVAIEWLDENGYDVTDIGPDVLRPYLADGQNLVAFRLSKPCAAHPVEIWASDGLNIVENWFKLPVLSARWWRDFDGRRRWEDCRS